MLNCPVCKEEMCLEKDKANNSLVYCSDCMTPHHLDCYRSNNATCATYACGGTTLSFQDNPSAVQQTALVSRDSIDALATILPPDKLHAEISIDTIFGKDCESYKSQLLDPISEYIAEREKCLDKYRQKRFPITIPYGKLKARYCDVSVALSTLSAIGGFSVIAFFFPEPSSLWTVFAGISMIGILPGGIIIGDYLYKTIAAISSNPEEVKRRNLLKLKDQWQKEQDDAMKKELIEINAKYAQLLLSEK